MRLHVCECVSMHMWTLCGLMNHKSILVLEGSNTEHNNNYIWCSISPHHSVSLIISLTTLLKVNFLQFNQQPCLKLLFSEERLSISLYYERREAIWNRKACFWNFGLNIIELFYFSWSQFYFEVFTLIFHGWRYTCCPCGSDWLPELDWFHLFLVMINCFTDC